MYAVPGPALVLDAYGSPRRAALVRILQAVVAAPRVGRGRRAARSYFAVQQPRGRLRPGIYERTAAGIRPAVLFTTDRPTYRQRVDFYGVARRAIEAEFARSLRRQIERAVAKLGR
jgi:hypothetical protein